MVEAPEKICDYLDEEGYDPNSPTRSRKVAQFIIDDILKQNGRLRSDAEEGSIVFETEYEIAPSVKPKIVLGATTEEVPPEDGLITQTPPDEIWLVMSYASIMTRHSQNINNRVAEARLDSFESYELNQDIVTSSFVLTNIEQDVDFEHLSGIRSHDNVEKHIVTILEKFGSIQGSPRQISSRLDAVGSIVIEYDGRSTRQFEDHPAPGEGDPLYYFDFIAEISNEIDSRFYNLPEPISAEPQVLIESGEGRTIDFKEEFDNGKSLAAEAAAFLNTEGGTILLGINDEGVVEGLDDIDNTHHSVSNALYDHLDGDISYETNRVTLEGEDVLLIRFPQSQERIHEVDGKFWIRVGESKKAMRFEVLKSHFSNLFQENPGQLFK